MRRYTRWVLLLALITLAICVAARLLTGGAYRMVFKYDPAAETGAAPEIRTDSDIVRTRLVSAEPGRVVVDIIPVERGSVLVSLSGPNGKTISSAYLTVDSFRTVYDEQTGSFNGDLTAMVSLTLFLLIVSAMMLHGYLSARGPALYNYSTVFYIGFFFFSLVTGLTLLNLTLRHMVTDEVFSMRNVYSSLSEAGYVFLGCTTPLLVLFCTALAVSNIVLLRHNRPRIQNVLGLIVSLAILLFGALGLWLNSRSFSGSILEYRIFSTVNSVYCAVYVYFECILAGAVCCGIRAARHQPPPDRDIIIILGCWFRKDGSLPPLLRGRVDRAVEYWHAHLAQTGRQAWIIPSGGQGPDESMPEAEAMKAYLVAGGIPEQRILPETRSSDTFENMSFSGQVMKDHDLSGSVVFATTNYHVFRSGMLAARAGLDAEGICSRTVWWFWPNAFLRECVGLIVNKWKRELLLLSGLVLFFALLSMTMLG